MPAARLLRPALLVGVLALAAAVRLGAATGQLATGELVPLDGDSAYHLERMTLGAARLPLPAFDRRMSWPRGALVPWADGFDLLGVAAMRAAGGAASPAAPVAAALLPVALGLLVVWATWSLAARLSAAQPAWTAAAAGILAATIPQAAAVARFGRIDHHVLEQLSLLLLAGWAMAPLWRTEGDSPPSPVRHELLGAATAWLAVAGFAGGTLYVAIALVIRLATLLADPRPRFVGSGATGLALGALATAATTWPAIAARGGAFVFDGPSIMQPALLLAAAASLSVAVLAARGGPPGRRPWLGVGAVAGLVAGGLLVPPIRHALEDGLFRFVLRRDPWLAGIQEFQPLLDGTPVAGRLAYFFGSLGPAAPILAAVAVFHLWRWRRPLALAFAWLLACAGALTLVQVRFGRVLAPLLAVAAALTAAAIAQWLARRLAPLARAEGPIGLAIIVALFAADPRLRGALQARAQPPSPAEEAALDLRVAPLDPSRPAVLSPWDLGHLLSVVGRRPALTNGFGSFVDPAGFREAEGAFSLPPPAFDALLSRRGAGLVVAGPATFGNRTVAGRRWYEPSAKGNVLDLATLRALPLSPLLIGGSAVPGAGVRHLEHMLPRFASSQVVGGLAFQLPMLWTYERVEGAHLRGRAPPGAEIVASIALRERGRLHAWRAFADANADGSWELVLPVPSSLATPTLHTAEAFELRADGGDPVRLAVPEATVRAGGTITLEAPLMPAPPPRAGAAPAPTRRSPPP